MTVLTGSDVEHKAYMAGLASKSDADIAQMRDEDVKQMLTDLRGIASHLVIASSNELIARLPEAKTKSMLLDIRDNVRRGCVSPLPAAVSR